MQELNDEIIVDEKSIKVSETKVELDVVDGRDANKRMHLVLDITADKLATPKTIKERISTFESFRLRGDSMLRSKYLSTWMNTSYLLGQE